MIGIKRIEKIRNEEITARAGVANIGENIREARLIERKTAEDNYSSSSVAVSVAGVGDHDLPLFAISCIHKHLRSASSQPGCYTVLYFIL